MTQLNNNSLGLGHSRPFMDDDYITLSALQHYTYCPRQCALIHTERVWRESALTTMGKIEHERANSKVDSWNAHLLTARSVLLVCHELGIQGIADIVEYQYDATHENILLLRPVEYKHGRPKQGMEDKIQLCAQALCLEEMHQQKIAEACLFYHSIRHREVVPIDEDLRELTKQCVADTRALLESKQLPPAILRKSCRACSLESLCLPVSASTSANEYIKALYQIEDNE